MGYGNLTLRQKHITREIERLKRKQRKLRNSWIDIDVTINALTHELDGVKK